MDRFLELWARLRRLGPAGLLLALGVAELAIYRIAVPELQVVVQAGERIPETPSWHAAVGWLGLFLHYFLGTLAVGILIVRAARAGLGDGARLREIASAGAMAVLAAIAALVLVLGEDATTALILETTLAVAMVVAYAVSLRRGHDLGAIVGLVLVFAPFLIHYYGVVAVQFQWDEADAIVRTITVNRIGVSALCLAAIASPYCFGPRPFARAVIKVPPIVFAIVVAGGCALLARHYYADVVPIVAHATGVKLETERVDPQLALYILAFATLCWTLVSCALAPSEPRRKLGLGLALIALGGYYEVGWPAYYAMIAVGVFTIVDAIPDLRTAERGHRVAIATPPIEDRIWQGWVTSLVTGLRGAGHRVNALTSRGDDDTMSTVVSGDVAARPFRMRIERVGGSVVAIDARFGRDLGDQRPATFTVQARPEGLREVHPEPPAAAPRVDLGEDIAFEHRFRSRGDRAELLAALDDGVRARLTATMDGWLAVWKGESVRHRVYPGRGAPIDHPIPLSDLAIRRAGPDAADRLITTITVLADVARRTLPETVVEEPPPTDADGLPPASTP